MEPEGMQCQAATKISELMNTAVTLSQQKSDEKKAKAREAKIRRQVKKLQKGSPETGIEEGDGDGGTKWFQPGELGIMIDHLENNYNFLFGNCKKANYKQQRIKAWQQLMEALNVWNEQSGTKVVRDMESVKRKIDNLKQRAKDKARIHRQQKAGGGPPPPALNKIDTAILRILGDSPSFQGVISEDSDTKIEMACTSRMSDVMAQCCNTEILAETPSLTKGLNSVTHLDLDNLITVLNANKQAVANAKEEVVQVQSIIVMDHDELMEDDGDHNSSGQGKSTSAQQADGAVPSTSSGPTQELKSKKRKKDGSDGAENPEENEEDLVSEQQEKVRVHTRRGYTTYPAFIFDMPPSQLTIEHLRRKYLIAEIERSDAEKLYYTNAVRFMAFMTETVRSFAGANGLQMPGKANESATEKTSDHGYSMGMIENPCDASRPTSEE